MNAITPRILEQRVAQTRRPASAVADMANWMLGVAASQRRVAAKTPTPAKMFRALHHRAEEGEMAAIGLLRGDSARTIRAALAHLCGEPCRGQTGGILDVLEEKGWIR